MDEEGHRQLVLDKIIDYQRNSDEVYRDEMFVETHTGISRKKITTKSWDIYVLWKDESTNWIALKDLQQSCPIEINNFARLNGIHKVTYFARWVPYVEIKRKTIISKLKSKYWKRMHKYGITIPKSVMEAYVFYKKNGNKL